MKGLDYSDIDPEFEDELRAMLRRRAAEVRPDPPDWQDVVRRSEAVVVSLRTGRPVDGAVGGTPGGRNWSWLRPVLAAAACLAIVMSAGIVIGRSTDSDGSPEAGRDDSEAAADIAAQERTLAAAGATGYAPATAAPLYPPRPEDELQTELDAAAAAGGDLPGDLAVMSDPSAVTREYLTSVGVADAPYTLVVDPPREENDQLGTTPDGALVETTRVWWSLRMPDGLADVEGPNGEPPVYTMGYVFLRNLTGPEDARTADVWLVVGAAIRGVSLDNVRRDGDQLSFDVTTYWSSSVQIDTSALPLQILVNGEEVAAAAELNPTETAEFSHPVPADQAATIRIQQIDPDPGMPVSIAETKFLPGAETTESALEDALAPTVEMPPGVDAVAVISDACNAPDLGLTLGLDLPTGFANESSGEVVGGLVADDGVCTVEFPHATDPASSIEVGWGSPPFPLPEVELQGPACFAYASLDDGGFVAVRQEPYPIYVTASGVTQEEFDQAITSSVLTGAPTNTWAADQGC
jgi:hypothetical protein